MAIKFLLVASIGLLAVFAASGRTRASHRAIRRGALIAVLPAGAIAVLFPGIVTDLAQLVGVGRGTDLVLYMLVVAVMFLSVSHYQRMRDIEDKYVTLARRVAIDDALRGDPITRPIAAMHELETGQGSSHEG